MKKSYAESSNRDSSLVSNAYFGGSLKMKQIVTGSSKEICKTGQDIKKCKNFHLLSEVLWQSRSSGD
ncbi:hypothetical protein QUB05_07375 [Microcoleus sp. F10-C6]|uniref:hypothetical protein n=1 Tax=unclassified Microcoleus TaxID=2642155 RepID=UPI002FD2AB2E